VTNNAKQIRILRIC